MQIRLDIEGLKIEQPLSFYLFWYWGSVDSKKLQKLRNDRLNWN